MTQLALPLLCRLDGPSVVNPKDLAHVQDYRQAVQACWCLRRDKADGAQSACARHIGAQVSHMSDYLSDDPTKRDMPAKFIRGFESWCGNTAITQWMASQARLTVAEELTAMRMA